MEFCPDCNNNLDIIPLSQVQTGGGEGGAISETISTLEGGMSLETIIDQALENKLNEKDAESVDINLLSKHPVYKKLSTKKKEIVLNRVKEHHKAETKTRQEDINRDMAFFFCIDCGYRRPIGPGKKIFSKSFGSSSIDNMKVNKDMAYSEIVPYTRKYTCINSKCESHKIIEKRIARIVRPDVNSFKTFYICMACMTSYPVDKPFVKTNTK
jgi:hypothetical protein